MDILADWSPEIVIKKCAQIGGSVTFNLKAGFAVKVLGMNVIYTFPTDSDVNEFVSSKTNKLLQANPQVFSGMPTDNIERKELDGRFIFFKGTVSKTAAIMTSADILIHDEASRSNQQALEFYKSRTKASPYGGRWLFSNPTTDNDEIDLNWRKSDQKEWVVVCGNGHSNILRWPENIDKKRECFICTTCDVEITREQRRLGTWVAQNPGSTVSGYHISLLMAPWVSASSIIKDSDADPEYFHNFVLGEPYSPGDLKITRGTIMDIWTPKDIEKGQYYLGVDVGAIKYWVLGSKQGILKCGRTQDWEDIIQLMRLYKPFAVFDAMPETTMSKYFVDMFPNTYMCYLGKDKEQVRILEFKEGKDVGTIRADRSRCLDRLIDDMLNARFLIGIPGGKEFNKFISHWEGLRRIKEVNNIGVERYAWEAPGPDHNDFVFAHLFMWIAQQADGSGAVLSEYMTEKDFIGRDNIVNDIAEYIDDVTLPYDQP